MRAEDMFKEYKVMCQELAMTAYEISHFTGITQHSLQHLLSREVTRDGKNHKDRREGCSL